MHQVWNLTAVYPSTEQVLDELQVGRDILEQRRARVGADALPRGPEHPVERHAGRLSCQVPEGDVERGEHLRRQRKHPRPDVVPERFPLQGVAPDEDGGDVADRLGGVLLEPVRGRVPDTGNRLDAAGVQAQHRVGRELRRQIVRPGELLRRGSDGPDFDAFDLHAVYSQKGSPSGSSARSTSGTSSIPSPGPSGTAILPSTISKPSSPPMSAM